MRLFRRLAATALGLTLSLLLAPPAFAQGTLSPQNNVSNEDSGIGVGAVIGVTRASFSSDVDANFEPGTGWMFGLWVGGNKNGLVGFTGEFLYVTRKTSLEGDTNELTQKALEIPAVFHINFGSHSRNKVGGYAVVGPVFTINLEQSLSEGVAGDNFNSADIGIIVGAGIEAFRIGFEVRGNWGLKSVANDEGGEFKDSKNRSIEILGKIRFN